MNDLSHDLSLYSKRYPSHLSNIQVVKSSYQTFFVAYSCNLISTALKIFFETNATKLRLNIVILYICAIASGSYLLLWTGYSPVVPSGDGSCLFIPQRYLLYAATAPLMMYLLAQISDYSIRLQARLILLHFIMFAAGLVGNVPGLSRPVKLISYAIAVAPFPEILLHKWRMVTQGMNEADDPATKRTLNFMRIHAIILYQAFPILYFGSILILWPIEVAEFLWSFADWRVSDSSRLYISFHALIIVNTRYSGFLKSSTHLRCSR